MASRRRRQIFQLTALPRTSASTFRFIFPSVRPKPPVLRLPRHSQQTSSLRRNGVPGRDHGTCAYRPRARKGKGIGRASDGFDVLRAIKNVCQIAKDGVLPSDDPGRSPLFAVVALALHICLFVYFVPISYPSKSDIEFPPSLG